MSGYSYPQNYTQAYSNDTNQSAYISSYDDEKLPNTIHPWSLLIGFASGISFSLIVILFVIGGMWVSNCTRILRYKKKAANFRSDSNPLHEEELQTTSEYSNLIELSPGSGVYLSDVECIETEEFQQVWENIKEYKSEKFICEEESPNASEVIQNLLVNRRIFCIASGSVKNQTKLYCFAKDLKMNITFLLEIVINQNKNAKLIVKSNNNLYLNSFIDYFFGALDTTCTRHSLPQSHS